MFPLQAVSIDGQAEPLAIASFEGKHGASCTCMIASPSSRTSSTLPALQREHQLANKFARFEATYNLSAACFSNQSKNYWLSRLVPPR